MEKALEILKELHNKDIWVMQQLKLEHIQVYEAIVELEAMKQRTCERCRHWGNSQYDWKTERVCNKQVCGPMCKENFTDNIFGCILHEIKANA